jgi:hypothetical protein
MKRFLSTHCEKIEFVPPFQGLLIFLDREPRATLAVKTPRRSALGWSVTAFQAFWPPISDCTQVQSNHDDGRVVECLWN